MADEPSRISEPRRSLCLYRRRTGRRWWRVDADISAAGALTFTSGDGNEWTATVAASDVPRLLAALRRDGDLAFSIGGDADDDLLAGLERRFGGRAGGGPFEEIKAWLDAAGIPWKSAFWAGDADAPADDAPNGPPNDATRGPAAELAEIIGETTALVARAGNDFSWSSWRDGSDATAELEGLLSRVQAEPANVAGELAFIFAPSGPLQELALSSGWADAYQVLAARMDAALAHRNIRRRS